MVRETVQSSYKGNATGCKVLARCVLLDFLNDVSAWSKPSSGGVLASVGQAGCLFDVTMLLMFVA